MSFEEIMRCLSEVDQRVVTDVQSLFDRIDRQTQKFADQTGLKCRKGCGACCENPEIETTVAELLPLAVYLWSMDLGEDTLQATRSKASQSVCVFYKPDPVIKGHGCCGIYPYRPGLCRFFGFSARKDKYGKAELVTCKIIKDSQPDVCKRVQAELQKGMEAPLLTELGHLVCGLDPVHGREQLPINQAIALSLQKVGYSIEKSKQ